MRLYYKLKLKCTSMYTNKGFTTKQEKQKPIRVNFIYWRLYYLQIWSSLIFSKECLETNERPICIALGPLYSTNNWSSTHIS